MHLRPLVRRTSVATLALVVAALTLVTPHGAVADEIDDVRTRAARVSAQITELNATITSATSEVEIANSKAVRIQAQIDEASERLGAAKRQESRTRRQLADFALRVYTTGGTGEVDLTALANLNGDEIGPRQGYQSTVVGDRQELVDALQAARSITEQRAVTLRGAKKRADTVADEAEAKRGEAERARRELRSIKAGLDGELARLVAERQQAEQRAAEARARAAAERVEAQAAATAAPPAAPSEADGEASGPPAQASRPAPTPVAPVAPPRPPANPGSAASAAVSAAMSQLGVPYLWGGTTPRGFDCSGLTQWAYAQAGVSLPRTTWDQRYAGRTVPVSQVQPGDLVFYVGYGHMAMAIGGGQVVHAPSTGDVVKVSSLFMYPPIKVVRPTG